MENYYKVLEVATDADPKQIRQSYLRAKNAYSQEGLALYSLLGEEECNRMQELIEEAYSVLGDQERRRQYDSAQGLNEGVNFQIPKQTQGSERVQRRDSSGRSMPQIVTTKKFALDYVVDSDFEQEIEKATEFSGLFLKKIREYKNVDIVRMSELTRISKLYLRYIESEEFDKLPAPVYVRGFVFQYAKRLKLNPDMVATSYMYRLKKNL